VTDHQKFVTGDYVGDATATPETNFGANPSTGEFLGKYVK